MALGPMLTSLLTQAGLKDLIKWATDMIVKGASEAEIELSLYDQPAFIARFPAIKARLAAGLAPISVIDYLNFESTVQSMASTAGMTLTKAEVDQLLIHDVSAVEVDKRIQLAVEAVQSDIETRTFLKDNYPGITDGQLMKFWMDPKAELPILQHQLRTGQIGGAAARVGYGDITLAQAGRLAEVGMDQQQAATGFARLVDLAPLFTPISQVEDVITTDEQIELLAGDQQAALEVEQRQRQRQAEFEGGGGYAQGKEGFATGAAR